MRPLGMKEPNLLSEGAMEEKRESRDFNPPWSCPNCGVPLGAIAPRCQKCGKNTTQRPYGLDFIGLPDQNDVLGFTPRERAEQYRRVQYDFSPQQRRALKLAQWHPAAEDYYDSLLSFMMPPRSRWILDVGCATGRITYGLAERWNVGAIGIDILDAHLMVAHSMAPCGDVNVAFARAHAEALPLQSASIGGALLSNIIDRVADPVAVLAEVHRVVEPGGQVVIAHTDDWLALDSGTHCLDLRTLAGTVGLKKCSQAGGEIVWVLPDARNTRHIHMYLVAIDVYTCL